MVSPRMTDEDAWAWLVFYITASIFIIGGIVLHILAKYKIITLPLGA